MAALTNREIIQSVFSRLPPGRVLDFGGGQGEIAAMVQARGHDVTVMDLDAEHLEVARASGLKTIQGDEDALDDMKETFDYAILSHVVEHVQCPHEKLLPRIHNRLKPGGKAVVAVPNVARLRNRAGLWLGHFSDGMVYQHVRFFTQFTLRSELTKGGFRVVEEIPFSYDWVTRVAARFSANFGDELIVVAERPPGPLKEIPRERTWKHVGN